MEIKTSKLLCLPFLLFACQGNKPIKTETPVNSETISETPAATKHSFDPEIFGAWVTSNYIQEIIKTRSPAKASDKVGRYSALVIHPGAIKGDSLSVSVSLGTHEGGNFNIWGSGELAATFYKSDLPDYENESNFYRLEYKIGKADTSLFLCKYNKQNKLIEKTRYVRVLKPQKSPEQTPFGIQEVVNKELLAGTYTLTDSLDKTYTVVMGADGSISGFRNFQSYYVSTDFDSSLDSDGIHFYDREKKSIYFAVKIKQDALELYEYITNEEPPLLEKGKLLYTLIRN